MSVYRFRNARDEYVDLIGVGSSEEEARRLFSGLDWAQAYPVEVSMAREPGDPKWTLTEPQIAPQPDTTTLAAVDVPAPKPKRKLKRAP